MSAKVKTRFAPSPTGYLHIGGARTALFAWLYARRYGGEFVLRIEDTDRARSTDAAIKLILDSMGWLGLNYDQSVVYQSKRMALYKKAIDQLLDDDKAYYCYCSKAELERVRAEARARGEKPKYNGKCRDGAPSIAADRSPVVRFKNPLHGEVVVADLIQGEVTIHNRELDDVIIARADGAPTYNLTAVVDDAELGITHVIRGDDHLNNTPRQINIFHALGVPAPQYAHIPLILGEDGRKLSKRHGAASVLAYRDKGYLPQALLNYLLRLGWSHGDQEIFSMDEMIALFDIAAVNRSAAAINPDKLLWLNQHYLKESEPEDIAKLLKLKLLEKNIRPCRSPNIVQLAGVQKERVKTIAEMAEQSGFFYADSLTYDEAAAKKHLRPAVLEVMQCAKDALSELTSWERVAIHGAINAVAERHGMKLGKVAQPLRVAVSGGAISPAIDVTLALLGREKALLRIKQALDYINRRAPA